MGHGVWSAHRWRVSSITGWMWLLTHFSNRILTWWRWLRILRQFGQFMPIEGSSERHMSDRNYCQSVNSCVLGSLYPGHDAAGCWSLPSPSDPSFSCALCYCLELSEVIFMATRQCVLVCWLVTEDIDLRTHTHMITQRNTEPCHRLFAPRTFLLPQVIVQVCRGGAVHLERQRSPPRVSGLLCLPPSNTPHPLTWAGIWVIVVYVSYFCGCRRVFFPNPILDWEIYKCKAWDLLFTLLFPCDFLFHLWKLGLFLGTHQASSICLPLLVIDFFKIY